jgi:hypothetical protein
MRIGSRPHQVSIQVIPSTSEESDKRQDGTTDHDSSSWTTEDSTTTSSDEEPCDSEAKLYPVDTLPQVVTS